MPVLRQAPDNTLAETLGNLGSSLSNAFNPLNQIRANNMMSEMQQRQWEIQHQQTLDAANRNAADVFVRTFDGILPPGVVASEGARIRAGNGNIENAVNAAKALGTWQGNEAAAKMIDADPEMADWDPADRENVKARVRNGESLTAAKQAHAQQKMEEAKTSGAIGARDAATSAATGQGFDPEAAALSGQSALLGQSAEAEKIINANRARIGATSVPASTDIYSPDVTAITQRQLEAGQTPTLPAQLGPQKFKIDEGVKLGDKLAGQFDPNKPFMGVTVDAHGNVTATPPAPPGPPAPDSSAPPPPPPGPPAAPDVAAAPPIPVDVTTTSRVKRADVAADTGTKFRNDEILKDVESGRKAYTLLRTVGLMRQYASELDNATPWDQAKNQFFNKVFEGTGITFTNAQSAREAFVQATRQLMGAARTDDGMQRVAGPELTVLDRQLPNPNQDSKSLIRSIDQLELKARRLMEEGKLASELYGSAGDTGITAQQFKEYIDRRNAIETPPNVNKPGDKINQAPLDQPKPAPQADQTRIYDKDGNQISGPPPD
jgi:hypothetical protein